MNNEEIFWLLNDLRVGCHESEMEYPREIGALISTTDELRSRRRDE